MVKNMLIKSWMLLLGLPQLLARHLRVQKCVIVENFSQEPAVVVVRPSRSDPMRVRVPSAPVGESRWNSQCFYDSVDVLNDYHVNRLSFENGAMKQALSAHSSENGLLCVVEDTNDLWCKIDYAT